MKMRTRGLAALVVGTGLVLGQFMVEGATLKHRYSFNETEGTVAADSVGGVNATLVNATFGDGYAKCDNPFGKSSADPTGQYIAFPPNMLTNYDAITMEAWVNPVLDDSTAGAFWARIWDFGNSDGTSGVNGFIYFRVGNSTTEIMADVFVLGLGDNWCSCPGAFLRNMEDNHVVWTADGATRKQRVYLNGVLVGSMNTFTNTPRIVGSTTNNWLARSQFSADPYATIWFKEFRIYEGALTPLEVALNYQNGPDVYSTNVGTVTSLRIAGPSSITVGAMERIQLYATTTELLNEVWIGDMDGVQYTSSNPSILTADAYGYVTGKGPGTAQLIATYGGISVTQTVTVLSFPTTLKHRYSFTSDASDSIGGKHGIVYGGAYVSDGRLYLNGQNGSYLELPSYIVDGSNILNKALTIEAWVTAYPQNGAWTRLFDFGTVSGTVGGNYFFLAPNTANNGGQCRVVVSDVTPGYWSESVVSTTHILGRTNLHIAAVFNPGRQFLGLYLNGILVGWTTTTKPYSSIKNDFSWIGRSLYSADSWLAGEVDEFRIYDGELNRVQLAASYASGPDALNFNPGTFVNMVLDTKGSELWLDSTRQIACAINFTRATNVNLLGDQFLTLTSSDTNILTVTQAGIIRGRRLGTAQLTATYQYVDGTNVTVYSTNVTITVTVPPAQLVHRYTFNEGQGYTVYDVIGGAHGLIRAGTNELGVTNCAWIEGQLLINTNTTLGAQDTYIDLPQGIVSSLVSNATFEAWVTVLSGSAWQRVFDFGSVPASPTNAAEPNIFLTRGPGGSIYPRYDWVYGNINSSVAWSNGMQIHIVVLHSGTDGSAKMYINGQLVASSTSQNLPLSSINDIYCFLGRSIYSWPISKPGGYFDPYLVGAFNEFRIYRGLLTEAEIQRNYQLGPDQLVSNVPMTFAVQANTIRFSWPRYAARFVLESTPVLGAGATWTPVGTALSDDGSLLGTQVQIDSPTKFFRLRLQ